MTPLETAKERVTISQLAVLRGWPWTPGKSCRIPYRQDRNASGSVLADGRLFHDFSSGETLDAPALLARVENITNEAACKIMIQLAGTHGEADKLNREPIRVFDNSLRTKPRLPSLTSPTPEEIATIAHLRNINPSAVRLAARRGFLFTTRVNNLSCWALTDRTRWLCQLRRMDGDAFPRREGPGFKAWTVSRSRGSWPLGCEESARFGSIALVEGGGDFLAAFHFIIAEQRGRDVAPVALLGASNRIAPETLKLFRSKFVRIFAHADKPHSNGARPGLEAAARWQEQLAEAGAVVDCFDFAGLRQVDGSAVADLNDMTRLHPDERDDNEELTRLMNFP